MKNILVICPNDWDRFYLEKNRGNTDFHYVTETALSYLLKSPTGGFIGKLKKYFDIESIDAAISTDESLGILLASWICRQVGCPAPDPELILKIQNKYTCRNLQSKSIKGVIPEYEFFSMESSESVKMAFPFFIKPTKGVFSFLSQEINSEKELENYIEISQPVYQDKLTQLKQLKTHLNIESEEQDGFLCEELLKGQQLTVEGYATGDTVHIMGIVDSVMYSGTQAFQRFEYPSKLPKDVQNRLIDVSKKLMSDIHFKYGLFNIEYFYDETDSSIYLLELNPRMSSVFSEHFDKVLGYTGYDVLLNIIGSAGKAIEGTKGRYSVASAFVLRRFEDACVKKMPTQDYLNKLKKDFDMQIKIDVKAGDVLSKKFPGHSNYKYATVHLGADTWTTLYEKFAIVEKLLDFEFE